MPPEVPCQAFTYIKCGNILKIIQEDFFEVLKVLVSRLGQVIEP